MKKKPTTVYLDDATYAKLQDLKITHNINVSSFIASAIKEKIDKEKPLAK